MSLSISEKAHIGANAQIGIGTIVEDNVSIGDGCIIGHHVVIHKDAKIGNHVRIDDHAIVGKLPMYSPRSIFRAEGQWRQTIIGDHTQIGANAIIYIQCEIGASNLIADMATIRENVTIGALNIIGRGVSIENFTTIGSRNKIETNVYITAYSTIADYCFIAPCVVTSNDNYVGRDIERLQHFCGIIMETGSRIGANCTILPGCTLGADCLVAAGSIVTKDIPKNELWMGSPAKFLRNIPDNQKLIYNVDK
jgi:hypothetical protein